MMMDKEMTIMTQPDEIFNRIVVPVAINVMGCENADIFCFT